MLLEIRLCEKLKMEIKQLIECKNTKNTHTQTYNNYN